MIIIRAQKALYQGLPKLSPYYKALLALNILLSEPFSGLLTENEPFIKDFPLISLIRA